MTHHANCVKAGGSLPCREAAGEGPCARPCRACDAATADFVDALCFTCYTRFVHWAWHTLKLDPHRAPGLIATERPEVLVALDQWVELGRPQERTT